MVLLSCLCNCHSSLCSEIVINYLLGVFWWQEETYTCSVKPNTLIMTNTSQGVV